MNYNSIDIGDEVAFVSYRNRGIFPRRALKAEVLDKRKRRKWGNTSQTGEVLLEFERYSSLTQEWISAYNVIDHWDRYEEERRALFAEEEKQRQVREQEREERERERQRIQDEKLARQRELESELLIRFGVPLGSVLHVTDYEVTLRREALEKILS